MWMGNDLNKAAHVMEHAEGVSWAETRPSRFTDARRKLIDGVLFPGLEIQCWKVRSAMRFVVVVEEEKDKNWPAFCRR